MAFLDWTDSLSVGFKLLDTDHKKLFDAINALHDASVKENNHAEAERTLTQLIDFTKVHFVHEETLMRKMAYPQIIPHKIEHDRLMNQIEDFHKRYTAGQVGMSIDTVIFLRTWLCDHILKVDILLGNWLAKHMPQAT